MLPRGKACEPRDAGESAARNSPTSSVTRYSMPHACARRGHYHRHIYILRRTTANTEAITPAVTTTMSPGQAGATKKTTPRKLMSGLTSQKTARHRLWNGVPHARWGIPPAHQELGPTKQRPDRQRGGVVACRLPASHPHVRIYLERRSQGGDSVKDFAFAFAFSSGK